MVDIHDAPVLPDSRARILRGQVFQEGFWWEPVFCASCSKSQGMVLEGMTYAFILCDECVVKYGPTTLISTTPGEQFRELMKEEMIARTGRSMTEEELVEVADADSSPLATLLKQGQHNLLGR